MITPQTDAPDIARELGIPALALKREDLHPYGSHKGRSIPVMIDMKVAAGATDFAISSSGNAAIAALRHIQKRNAEGNNLTLSILVGSHINPKKRQIIESEIHDDRVTIEESPRPLQTLMQLVTGKGKTSLRQSTDPEALVGYRTLAQEIAATPDLSAVFIGSSSGTAAEAIAEYFTEHKDQFSGRIPEVHVVQTTTNPPIALALDAESPAPDDSASLADAIVDKVAHRKDALVRAIRATGGTGWIASNADIVRARSLLHNNAGIEATGNGALGLAGLIRARASGKAFSGTVVCTVTGI